MTEGFESYRSFAPPELAAAVGRGGARAAWTRRSARADVWCMLAEAGDELAGHVAIAPGRDRAPRLRASPG